MWCTNRSWSRRKQCRHGEFRLSADDTKIALGPNARLVLDKFVYDPNAAGKQVLINFAVGAFRFISSSKDPTGYELKTPTATLGVRGTVFDFYVAEKGGMAVLMHKGAVEVCSAACKLHSKLGRLAFVTPSGKVVLRRYWDRKLMPGVAIKQAFPFLGKKLMIDDVIRTANLTAPASKAAPGKQAATKAAIAPTFAFNAEGTMFGLGFTSVSQPGPVGGRAGGPGNGNGNSPNAGNGGGNLGGGAGREPATAVATMAAVTAGVEAATVEAVGTAAAMAVAAVTVAAAATGAATDDRTPARLPGVGSVEPSARPNAE